MYIRYFFKFGESIGEVWRQWKGLYYISMIFCYVLFLIVCWKMYIYFEDWSYGFVFLKYVIGVSLIVFQFWIFFSIYEFFGEFGWFYGDFFFESFCLFMYNLIYCFFNNLECVFGVVGFWGLVFIIWSKVVFVMVFVSQFLMLGFILFVEKFYM